MRLPISVCMLANNEEEIIAEAIRSVIPFVEEVVVLDTGSTDNTVVQAKKAGAKVYTTQWKDSFSHARNELIQLATCGMVLMMDADERYEGNRTELESCVGEKAPFAGRVKIINLLEDNDQSETYITRIFSRDSYKYEGRIHEQLVYNKQPANGKPTDITLLHYGYRKSVIDKKQKMQRNLSLLLKELGTHPNDPYLLFQIGRTLYVGQDYKQANMYFDKALNILGSLEDDYNYTSSLIVQYAYSLLKEKNWIQLEKKLSTAIEKYPDFTDLYYIYAALIIESRAIEQFHLIPELYQKCLQLGEADSKRYETSRGVGSFKALYNLGLYYEITGQTQLAAQYYIKSSEMSYDPAKNRLDLLIQ